MQVRIAREADAQALCVLNREFNGEGTASAHQIARSLRESTEEIAVLALEADEPAGFLCARCIRSLCYRDPSGQIAELYVREAHRRRGFAAEMLRLAERELSRRGVREVFLLTGGDNAAAQAFYASSGYAPEDERMFLKCL